jgi:hypothetical protein
VDSYNEELREAEGFVGDRASGQAFRKIIDHCRAKLEAAGLDDPLGEKATRAISKAKLDKILLGKDPLASGRIQTAVQEFGTELAAVIRRFLYLPAWVKTERIVIGGGLSASHMGELAIGRAAVILAEQSAIQLCSIVNHPDEAELIGAAQLAPSWVLDGHGAVLAADIGGTNMRAGLLRFKIKNAEVSDTEVVKRLHWRHADDKPTRDEAIDRLAEMLKELAELAGSEKLKLARFVGLACPGLIDERGTILRGGQNLPGNWEGEDFNLPAAVAGRLRRLGNHEPAIVMHNDAVVQRLSEVPNMQDVGKWAVLTIGTGLGNAHYTNRPTVQETPARKSKKKDHG